MLRTMDYGYGLPTIVVRTQVEVLCLPDRRRHRGGEKSVQRPGRVAGVGDGAAQRLARSGGVLAARVSAQDISQFLPALTLARERIESRQRRSGHKRHRAFSPFA